MEDKKEFKHISVLYDEVLENLNIRKNKIYVDCTLGGAGHSNGICERLENTGRLIGIDQDKDAIKAATERLSKYTNVTIVRSNYENFKNIISDNGIEKVDGILMDLGVSSYQLDEASRGFSYMSDASLDMRMDDRSPLSAKVIVNTYSESDLFRVIRDYGEEAFAKNIAKHIVAERQKKEIETTFELVEIIKNSIPAKIRMNSKSHPAKKTFQAIRIECNHELAVLENTIDEMINSLENNGRLCIISFHSLEDRIVKNHFRKAENPCECPARFPVCVCGKKPLGKCVSNKPILPTDEEMEANSRSKSAKLRVFERIIR
ncbi:MAG: 16S rRNA (cytosine(1402)-N(4))-methyltransferase RsmH [Lachnospiraceae bacterium]|nr:16S rRNA (cytosine(1402)-N(4))-methyltransferase RsmH [Lachnospiraceae bacterium]